MPQTRTSSRAPAAFAPGGRARRILTDPVALSLAAAGALLAVLDPAQIAASARFTAVAVWQMAPFFALAIGVAAAAKASGADAAIARVFAGRPLRATALAALAGALSPFCSCGVIPLIAAMLGAGVPLAPVMAFWIASPIMDPEMFILTAAGIGVIFAAAKTAAAIAMGLFAGGCVLLLQRRGFLAAPLRAAVAGCGTGCAPDARTNTPRAIDWRFWRRQAARRVFAHEARAVGAFLGKWLVFAFFLESLMLAYIPPGWVGGWVGAGNAFAIPLAALIGAPSYLNGYAAIPLVAGLLEMGMTPGAALAFMTAGAVSSIPAAVAVFALVKKPVFALYLALGLSGAVLTAFAYALAGGAL